MSPENLENTSNFKGWGQSLVAYSCLKKDSVNWGVTNDFYFEKWDKFSIRNNLKLFIIIKQFFQDIPQSHFE